MTRAQIEILRIAYAKDARVVELCDSYVRLLESTKAFLEALSLHPLTDTPQG